jgi:hypothetical protein
VRGVECQFGHTTITAWENDIAQVVERLDVDTPLQKALSGTLECIPLYCDALIQNWKERITDYPDALAQGLVAQHLRFNPVWLLEERVATRDATLWWNRMLLDTSHNLLAVLAGLNRVYFTTFQFKRMRRFINQLQITPNDLAARLDGLFCEDRRSAADELEALVRETLDLVVPQCHK